MYALHVSLGLEKGHTRIVAPLTLKVPVQVSAVAGVVGQEQQRLMQLAEQAERDAEFEPVVRRSTTMSSTMELPPGYEVQNVNGFTSVARNTYFA